MIPKRRTRPRMISRELIEERSMPEPNSGCWLWIGAYKSTGYGVVSMGWPRVKSAHRISFEVFKGPIPPGAFVCHHCDNRACVNPDHLFLGDALINAQDMYRKGRRPAACGERVSGSKLTEAQARAIFSDTRSTRFIVKEYGVCSTAVRKIRAKTTWKHIHAPKA